MSYDFNKNARYDMIQRLEKANISVDGYYRRHKKNYRVLDILGWLAVVGVFGVGMTLLVDSCQYKERPNQLDCNKCHGLKVKMTEYFQKNNVKSPQEMAEAVMKTKSPRLMAAINVGGEKKTPHTARNTGWRRQHSGAWQVNEKSWGKVSRDITEQALQAELVLGEHLKEEKSIVKSLNAYGGESNKLKGKYAYNVLNELSNVP